MMVNKLKESTYIPDKSFPINVFFTLDIPLHWHDHMEWIIVKEGSARIQIDDTFVQLQKDELAFVNSKQLHAAWPLDNNTELIAIVFNEALVRNNGLDNTENLYFSPYLNQQLKLPNFLHNDEPYSKEISTPIYNLIDEFKREETGFELLIKAELFRIFGLIFRYYCQMEKRQVNCYQNYNLTTLLNYLRENYEKEISVKDAAQMVNLSPNYFCRVFKKVTGKTLIEYIHLLRINEAERMLIETNWQVTEIAEKVGFESITYFGRVFKKIKSVSPTEVRNDQIKKWQ
ncbi:AraC family transcriptional regulator [Bacillus sp. SA1-12]|uniref:AraC family transcriptional regulator n=1 Tax=Bacillus sp. SA1-12 TaxID=1455638 RepID=UPI000A07CD3C|nr:AraC family transcriptional regulator [Bacillus sp. SA1-12]